MSVRVNLAVRAVEDSPVDGGVFAKPVVSLQHITLYLKTKSLRLPILSHFLTDLGNMSSFLFMNLVTM